MENSVNLERTKKFWKSKVHNAESFQETMNDLEASAKQKIESILDKEIKDITKNVLKQNDCNITLKMIKKNSWTIDTFKERIKWLLRNLFETTD